MSRQGSNHEIIELGEDEEDLDLPSTEEMDIEYDVYDHDFRNYLGEDADQEEYDEPEYDPYEYDEPFYFMDDDY